MFRSFKHKKRKVSIELKQPTVYAIQIFACTTNFDIYFDNRQIRYLVMLIDLYLVISKNIITWKVCHTILQVPDWTEFQYLFKFIFEVYSDIVLCCLDFFE